ncbi:hypothetical protein [Nitrospirillum sp. BR 11828]|uniref:hypothetical protein n=1 Tax=Nitrospirillum sp. BR 11828 TaxID=3104325 RepID=UPI002ACACAF1|nr:hypothetical protein [Nitrospirillum sp. BR 11828]MDZ5650775.1 hypothetical protein [Nitrospirillum sp. BR 11828]
MARTETMSLKTLAVLAVILTAVSGIMEVSSRRTTLSVMANAGFFLFAASLYFAVRNRLSDQTARLLGGIYLLICVAAVWYIGATLLGF